MGGKAGESLLPKSLACNAARSARSEHYRSFAYWALASFRITPGGLAVSAELVRLLRMDYSRMTLAWELKSLAPGSSSSESGMHGAFGLSAASSTGRLQHPPNQLIRQYFALENRSVGLYFNQNLARELFRLIQRWRTILAF